MELPLEMRSKSPKCETGFVVKENGGSMSSAEDVILVPDPQAQLEQTERKVRVNAAWEQMNNSVSVKIPKSFTSKPNTTTNKTALKASPNWMTALGLAPKKAGSHGQDVPGKRLNLIQNHTSDEAKRLAAAAISAAKDAAAAAAAGRGKIEVTEVRDFAGEDIEFKRLVDADSKEATEKAKVAVGGPPSAVDAVLEQIKKKQKLSVLDKTKKDWGEFKEENKGLEDQLDAYKKSSNQYLDKVSFLQRTDIREFERERDARLSLQSKRKSEVREDL